MFLKCFKTIGHFFPLIIPVHYFMFVKSRNSSMGLYYHKFLERSLLRVVYENRNIPLRNMGLFVSLDAFMLEAVVNAVVGRKTNVFEAFISLDLLLPSPLFVIVSGSTPHSYSLCYL